VVVHRGAQGGIELAFNYRTRLTGLAADEAEALGVLLSRPAPELEALGIGSAARRAAEKLLESLPDPVRARADVARAQFRFEDGSPGVAPQDDARVAALADAVRRGQVVRLQARSRTPRVIHPVGLLWRDSGWCVVDGLAGDEIVPLSGWGDVNISARRFAANPARA
jgi:predicted DNA-binding transcriptional regulator YafY